MTQQTLDFSRPKLQARQLRDQYGDPLVAYTRESRTAYVYHREAASSSSPAVAIAAALSRQNLHVIDASERLELPRLMSSNMSIVEDVKVAKRPGWIGARTFVHPNGTAFTEGVQDTSVIKLFQPDGKWQTCGSLETWLASMAILGKDQWLLQSLICFGLAPLLMDGFAHLGDLPGNISLQLTGPTSTGKTTALRVVTSLWGGRPADPMGALETWHSTQNGIEVIMPMHNGALLCLDEATLAGSGKQARSEHQTSTAFMLASGRGKLRFDSDPDRQSIRLVTMSTSNEPLLIGGNSGNEIGAALSVRMITVDLTDRVHGILDVPVPDGAHEHIRALNSVVSENFGHVALEAARLITAIDPEFVAKKIKFEVSRFRAQAGYPGLQAREQRICNAFAFAFAAGMVNHQLSLVPSSWTGLGGSLLQLFRLVVKPEKTASARVLRKFEQHLNALGSGLISFPPGVRRQAFKPDALGLMVRPAPYKMELLLRPDAFRQARQNIPQLAGVLDAEGLLVRDGNHYTTKRKPGLDGQTGRYVVILINPHSKPRNIRLTRDSDEEAKVTQI